MKKFGLLGEHLGHSFSKGIHEHYFEKEKIDADYTLIEKNINEIESLMTELREKTYDGINVTIPYKVEVMKYLDDISDESIKIGAVNTILSKDGKLYGHNTDYFGFKKTLEYNKIDICNKKVLILGTGGASKAVYSVISDLGASNIYLASIIENDNFPVKGKDYLIRYSDIKDLTDIELIVNCTPSGMYPQLNQAPLNAEQEIPANNLVDIIYNPEITTLMLKYSIKGANVVNGLMMLVAQAIKSEEIWNEKEFSDETFIEIYEKIKSEMYKKVK